MALAVPFNKLPVSVTRLNFGAEQLSSIPDDWCAFWRFNEEPFERIMVFSPRSPYPGSTSDLSGGSLTPRVSGFTHGCFARQLKLYLRLFSHLSSPLSSARAYSETRKSSRSASRSSISLRSSTGLPIVLPRFFCDPSEVQFYQVAVLKI